jgi:hypothetical protein
VGSKSRWNTGSSPTAAPGKIKAATEKPVEPVAADTDDQNLADDDRRDSSEEHRKDPRPPNYPAKGASDEIATDQVATDEIASEGAARNAGRGGRRNIGDVRPGAAGRVDEAGAGAANHRRAGRVVCDEVENAPAESKNARRATLANTRQPGDSNARQDANSNARQTEKPNTRQPAQTIGRIGDNPISSNARRPSDGHLGNEQVSNTRQAPGGHLKTTADGHMNRPAANTRQAISLDTAFDYEAQLWRLETYEDRYGRTICKWVVRFARTRATRSAGEVTPELAAALSRRPGKGRTAEARAEAERSRLLAESLAKQLRRAKASRRRNATGKGRGGRKAGHNSDAFGSELLPEVSDFSRHEGTTYVH